MPVMLCFELDQHNARRQLVGCALKAAKSLYTVLDALQAEHMAGHIAFTKAQETSSVA